MRLRNPFRATERQAAALQRLLTSPVVDQVLAADEAEQLRKRTALIAQLREAEKKAAHELPAATREAAAAAEALQAADAALKAAVQRDRDARHGVYLAAQSKARGKLETEIRRGADPRIKDFREYVEGIVSDPLVWAYRAWGGVQSTPYGPRTVVETTTKQIEGARTACAAALARTHELEMQALGYADVTAALCELCLALSTPLGACSVNPPQIAADGEVGPPLLFRDHPEWIVDELQTPEKRQGADKAGRSARALAVAGGR
jgi:hypothetical protein